MEMINKEQIGKIVDDYLKAHLTEYIEELAIITEKKAKEISLTERVVRVEEELKYLREDMNKRFEAVDKRFEELREDMNKRFDMMFKFMSIGFAVISLLIIVFKFLK